MPGNAKGMMAMTVALSSLAKPPLGLGVSTLDQASSTAVAMLDMGRPSKTGKPGSHKVWEVGSAAFRRWACASTASFWLQCEHVNILHLREMDPKHSNIQIQKTMLHVLTNFYTYRLYITSSFPTSPAAFRRTSAPWSFAAPSCGASAGSPGASRETRSGRLGATGRPSHKGETSNFPKNMESWSFVYGWQTKKGYQEKPMSHDQSQ